MDAYKNIDVDRGVAVFSLAAVLALLPEISLAEDYSSYVNTLMGTQSTYELSAGNTYPAVAMPWGMNFWTPQTGKMGSGWQYTYTANSIRGFKQTHQPSPWINDYGQFSIMPLGDELAVGEDERASWFSHKSEDARPYYYRVYLSDHDVTVELTPTARACMFRFTFPERERSHVVIDAFDSGSHVEIDTARNRVTGYTTRNSGGVPANFRNYFVVEFDRPFTWCAVADGDSICENATQMTAGHAMAVVSFATVKGDTVLARVGSSFISAEQAELNLLELAAGFDENVERGRREWAGALGRIEVEGGTVDQKRTFYSCLYRSLLFPRRFYEIDAAGDTVHYSPYTGETLPGVLYTDTGFWDTFRSLFPLLNLVYPSVNAEMQEGLMNAYRESGFFPEWASPGHRACMVGNNSASVLADAFVKGVRVADVETLYQGLLHARHSVHPDVPSTGRLGHEYFNTLGYVPCDAGIDGSAARTLEYAYDDWCILQVAKSLGRPDDEIERLTAGALSYRNLFDPSVSLMRGRRRDGSFAEPFSPLKWGDAFTEGNSWHYTWSVFHDPQGLIDLMGGCSAFTAMLDSVFALPPAFDASYYGRVIHEIREMAVAGMGNYAHGNQPMQHAIYLYNYAGQPWKAQYWLREVMDRLYSPAPDGYCGDEDNGQTSAWYVFSALGFYPVCPGSDQYVVGSPLFEKAVIHTQGGADIIINAPGVSSRRRYISDMKLNGNLTTKCYIEHSAIVGGAVIDFTMGEEPNVVRGAALDDAPYSFSR